MISPEFERLSEEYSQIVFLKIDVDEVEVCCSFISLFFNHTVDDDSTRSSTSTTDHHHMHYYHVLVQAVAASCGISAMPTFQVWKNGEKVDELVGASKERLLDMIKKYA